MKLGFGDFSPSIQKLNPENISTTFTKACDACFKYQILVQKHIKYQERPKKKYEHKNKDRKCLGVFWRGRLKTLKEMLL